MSNLWPYPGARWWKFDFHTHTPVSVDTATWQAAKGTRGEVTPELWLLKYMAAKVDCIAITDHNSGQWIDELKAVLNRMKANPPQGYRELHLFPGVEISVNGGFHLLALFDGDTTTSDIDTLLGQVHYDGTKGNSDGVTRRSPVEVIEAVVAAGGLAIPAHVDMAKGLLELDGADSEKSKRDANTLRQVFGCKKVSAMEVVNRDAQKPHIYAQSGCGWSEVLGSDCHSFQSGTQPGERFTWIKMAQPTLEGLRLALLDGAYFSVRRSDESQPFDPFVLPEHLIESISISDARYMGHGNPEVLHFGPWLNALVGGRGTGKSTVAQCLRLAFHRESEVLALPQENDTRRAFERFVKPPQNRQDNTGALDYQSTKKSEIVVTLKRDGVRHRLRWRQNTVGISVEEDSTGGWQPSTSQSVTSDRFPVRIFNQGQIAALAGENQEALLGVIDDAAKSESAKNMLKAAKQRYLSLSARTQEVGGKLSGWDDAQVRLGDVKRKLASFEGKQHADVLKAYQLRSRQERELERQFGGAAAIATQLHELKEICVTEDPPLGIFDTTDMADQHALETIGRLKYSIAESVRIALEAGRELESATQGIRSSFASGAWQATYSLAKTNYLGLVDALKAQGVADPSEYGELVLALQRIEGEVTQFEVLKKEQAQLVEELTRQRQMVREARQKLSAIRENFLANTLAQNPYVRIELVPYGRDAYGTERGMRVVLGVTDDRFGDDILVVEGDEIKQGIVADLLNGLPTNKTSAVTEIERRLDLLNSRLRSAAEGRGDFGGHFNNYLERESARSQELLDGLLLWSPEDGLKVEYSPMGDGKNFRSIGQASAGQRAAAMLAFLLAYGDEPLVLDQPEDDLDNYLIYDLVVRQIRANKLRRQILVVTHNANIVVNGDAEMLHAFDFKAGQCRVVEKGSLQDSAMREQVCRVMEGGREAFEHRYKRLGRDT